jgi:hypothetical protein
LTPTPVGNFIEKGRKVPDLVRVDGQRGHRVHGDDGGARVSMNLKGEEGRGVNAMITIFSNFCHYLKIHWKD